MRARIPEITAAFASTTRTLPAPPREIIVHSALHWAASGDTRIRANLERLTQLIHQADRSKPQEDINALTRRLNVLLADMGSDFRVDHLRNAVTVHFDPNGMQTANAIKNGYLTALERSEHRALENRVLKHLAKKTPTDANVWMQNAVVAPAFPTKKADQNAFLFVKATRNLGGDPQASLERLYAKSRKIAALNGPETRV